MTQETNIDRETIGVLNKRIDHPLFDVEKLQEIFSRNDNNFFAKNEVRELFEEMYGKQLDLSTDGGHAWFYKNIRTHVTWCAFVIALKKQTQSFYRTMKNAKRKDLVGPYINGSVVEDGTVQFSKRPFIHTNVDKAIVEANKLSKKFGSQFAVFAQVFTTDGNVREVEETKQKEKGVHKPNAERVLTELSDFIITTDICNYDVPVGIDITGGGRFCVKYSLTSPVLVENFNEAICHISAWLKRNNLQVNQAADDTRFALKG